MASAKIFTVAVLVVAIVCSAVVADLIYARRSGGTTTTQEFAMAEYPFPTENATSAISARVGEVFAIQLSSNAGSTGFDWSVSCGGGVQYVNYTVLSTSTLPGGPQIRNYFFRALAAGSTTIILQDKRPFAPYKVAAVIDIRLEVT